ncbi:NAD-dependent deacetylase sirtuin-2 [Aureobasidium pullulans]|uniref:NAD-dependent deacetylase sirtuin-2 n=1 Tax=Aureobasidium pullulans TaxID=5580 RepID=A0A4T0B461_AURPU|nr:NAD-dependent deacetylase sirtuin-2 [Aureobasidium pullulans]
MNTLNLSNTVRIRVAIPFNRWFRDAFKIGRKNKPHRQAGAANKDRGKVGKGRSRMGQDGSSPVDEGAPSKTLESRTLDGLAKYIRDGHAKRIVVMTGAGISTSAGIPDFRSPNTGLYANLARLKLPYAEAVFDISYFRENPTPFYTLAHELYPGKYRPTVTHSFIRLLHEKGLLLKLFTQNIDCLEREAGVPDESIIEAHGSFARQSCIDCRTPYPQDELKKHIEAKTIPHCHKSSCNGLVKPEIVFFGEQLPSAFFDNIDVPTEADLCIVLGTSLQVQPFASLPGACKSGVPRVLINMERVGGLGSRSDDVLLLGDCDAGVRKLAKAVGWEDDLEDLWAKTDPEYIPGEPRKTKDDISKEEAKKTRDEKFQDEIDKLTKEVDKTLDMSKWHQDQIRKDHLDGQADIASQNQASGEKTMRYDENADDKTKAPADGLGHVFPHMTEKSSL